MKTDNENETIADSRLCSWPKVSRDGKGMLLKFRVITPLRLSLIEELIFTPLTAIWRMLAFIYIINLILYHLNWVNLFPFLPFSQEAYLIGLVIPLCLWGIERFGGYPISRLLFGKYVHIRITDDEVKVRIGLLSLGESFERSRRIVFVRVPFDRPATALYRKSESLFVIVGDARREKMLEVFNSRILEKVVTNANVALDLHRLASFRDTDPTSRGLAGI